MFRALDNFFLQLEQEIFNIRPLGEITDTDESQIIAELNKAFNAKLDEFKDKGNALKNHADFFSCGKPMLILSKAELNPKHEIILNQSVLSKAIGLKKGKADEAHNLHLSDFVDFPQKIHTPILIIQGKLSNSRLFIIPIKTINGRTTVAALHLEFWNEKGVFTNIASVYTKPNIAISDLLVMAVAKNEVYYIDKEKIKSLLSLTGQLQLLPSLIKGLNGNATKLSPKIEKDKIFNQKNILAKLVQPENCKNTRDCAIQLYECMAAIQLLKIMQRNYTNVQKRFFALADRFRKLAKTEGIAHDWRTAVNNYINEPNEPVNGLEPELIEEIASIPDSKPQAEPKAKPEPEVLKLVVESEPRTLKFKTEPSETQKAQEAVKVESEPELTDNNEQSNNEKFDFIYEVSHGGGYYIKTFLYLPVSASVKDATTGNSTIPGLRNYTATEKGLKYLQAKYTSAYGDKQRLGWQDLNNPTPEPAKPSTILPRVSPDDIDYNRAYRAYTGTSFDPEKRAKSAQEEWANAVNEFAEKLESVIKTDEQNTEAKREFSDYVAKSKSKYLTWLGAKSNCISSMITGPSNFPVRRAENANRAEQNRGQEYFDFTEKAEARILKYIKGLDKAGMAAELDKKNEKVIVGYLADIADIVTGKSPYSKTLIVDAFFRKLEKMPREAKQYAIDTFKKYQDETGTVLFKTNHRFWRMLDGKAETEVTEQTVNKTTETIYKVEGVEIVNNFEAERVQIATIEKPKPEVISYLKHKAFKWSPSGKVWQRQNTNAGVAEALRFGKIYYPQNEPTPDSDKLNTTQSSSKVQVLEMPVSEIHTDEKRFQNRVNAFSEDSKNRIIKAVESGVFDWAKFDPILIWFDQVLKKYFVLSGHSRRAAFIELAKTRAEFKNIPFRIFEGTEKQAIDAALNSNTLSTKETEVERALYYNRSRQMCEIKSGLNGKSDCEKLVETQCREAEGKNANYILNLSYLNPEGFLMDMLTSMGTERDNDSTNVLRTVANWVGEARRTEFAEMSDIHETEIAKFLLNGGYGNKSGQFRNKTAFFDRLRYSIDRWKSKSANPHEPLNIANTIVKSSFETEHDSRLDAAKKAYDLAQSEHEEKYNKYLYAVLENRITQARMDELMKPLALNLARIKADYERIKGQKEAVKEAANAQTSLFGVKAPQTNYLASFTPFSRINGGRKVETYKLTGDLGKFLGYYDRVCYTIALRGDKGAGKSRLLFQMVNAFQNNKLKCAVVSCEMMTNSSIVTGYRDEYLSPENREKVEASGDSPTYDELNQLCKHFDVVAIDSWTKLNRRAGLPQTDFDRLQKENPETIIIVIFQSTTGKVVRGGNMPEFDAGTVIHVGKGGRAVCEKNRYNATDVVYNVFEQKLESAEETE